MEWFILIDHDYFLLKCEILMARIIICMVYKVNNDQSFLPDFYNTCAFNFFKHAGLFITDFNHNICFFPTTAPYFHMLVLFYVVYFYKKSIHETLCYSN